MNAQKVQELPVLLKAPELALAFFEAHEDSALGTSLNQRPGDDVMFFRDYSGHTVLSVPGTKGKGGEYLADKELRTLVGDFSGDRRRVTVNVPRNKLEWVIEQLYDLGTNFVVGPEYRAWVNQAREHLAQAKVAESQEVEAEETEETMAATGSLSH